MANTIEQQPNSREAEEALLGSILIDPDAILRVTAQGLLPAHFYRPGNQVIYRAMLTLFQRGEAIDHVTLASALEQVRHGQGTALAFIGGASELTRLIGETVTSVHAEHYARVVQDLAFRRGLIDAAREISALAYEHEGTRDQLQEQAAERFAEAVAVTDERSHLYGTDDALVDYLVTQGDRQERLEQDPHALVLTPWQELNAMLVDVDAGIVHVVAARPGVGKTIYLENVAEYNAMRGKAIAFYHLELSHQIMLDRRMCRWSGVPYEKLRAGYSGREVIDALDKIRVWQRNVTYVHCPGWSAERIMADVARMQAEGRADVVVIDYLQKIPQPDMRNRNEASVIGKLVSCIKDGAERLGVPVFLGCQVTRDLKSRGANGRPTKDDLFGSGLIEAYTNQIVILHEPDQESKFPSRYETRELYVDKNSQGRKGKVLLQHVEGQFRFESGRL